MARPRLFGLNQIRILHALMDGPLLGLYRGPRSVVSVIDNAVPWMPNTRVAKPKSDNVSTLNQRAYMAMKRLVKDGYVKRDRHLVDYIGKQNKCGAALRNFYTVTMKGIEEFRRQTDPLYRHELIKREREDKRRLLATYLRWNESRDPGLRWPRWYAVKSGWRALVEKHPVRGWSYQIITPQGAASDWKASDKQEKPGTCRKAEATLRHFAQQRQEALAGSEDRQAGEDTE